MSDSDAALCVATIPDTLPVDEAEAILFENGGWRVVRDLCLRDSVTVVRRHDLTVWLVPLSERLPAMSVLVTRTNTDGPLHIGTTGRALTMSGSRAAMSAAISAALVDAAGKGICAAMSTADLRTTAANVYVEAVGVTS